MTVKDLFRIVIKLFSLYLIISTLFSTIPYYLSSAYYADGLVILLTYLGALAIILGLVVVLLVNTDRVIDWLKLDKGFDKELINFSDFDSFVLLKLGFFIIGGFLLIDYIPEFLVQTYWALRFDIDGAESSFDAKFDWGISAINITIGFVFVTNYERMARIFSKYKTSD